MPPNQNLTDSEKRDAEAAAKARAAMDAAESQQAKLDRFLEPARKRVASGKANLEKTRGQLKSLEAAIGNLEGVLYTARRLYEQGIDPKEQLDAACKQFDAAFEKEQSAIRNPQS